MIKLRGRKCDNCGHCTLFLMNGIWRCSECGVSICNEWGEVCPHGLHERVQEICLACWKRRLDTRKNSTAKDESEHVKSINFGSARARHPRPYIELHKGRPTKEGAK